LPGTSSISADRFFPPTAWTLVLEAGGAAPDHAREELCKTYWKPVALFLQSLGLSEPDAEDGAQEIMAQVFGSEGLKPFSREQGRMRHYLKSAARHYFFNHRRDANTRKRGGGAPTLSLDEMPPVPVSESACDALFDKAWALALCERAMSALEASCARRGKGPLFHALKPTLTLGEEVKPYAEIGSLFGVTEQQIRIEVFRLRRRLAEFLRAEVAATMQSGQGAAAVEDETRHLIRALAYEPAS